MLLATSKFLDYSTEAGSFHHRVGVCDVLTCFRRAPLTYSVDSQQLSSSPRKEEREEREPISAHQLELARQIDGVRTKAKPAFQPSLFDDTREQVRGALQELVTSSSLLPSLLDLCKALAPVLESGARVSAPLGAMAR